MVDLHVLYHYVVFMAKSVYLSQVCLYELQCTSLLIQAAYYEQKLISAYGETSISQR